MSWSIVCAAAHSAEAMVKMPKHTTRIILRPVKSESFAQIMDSPVQVRNWSTSVAPSAIRTAERNQVCREQPATLLIPTKVIRDINNRCADNGGIQLDDKERDDQAGVDKVELASRDEVRLIICCAIALDWCISSTDNALFKFNGVSTILLRHC